MQEDFFLLDLPIYKPIYKENTVYGYSSDKKKQNTIELLTETSNGYCMYCYNRVVINGNNYAHIEHGIEKKNTKCLEDCVPNLGLACSKCNQSYKGKGEKERNLTARQKQKLNACKCESENCKAVCKTFQHCRNYYVKKWRIILQPFGVERVERRKRVLYKIQFNLLTGEYIASEKENYSERDIEFIKQHINFFGLNDVERRNKELAIYCKNVIAEKSLLKGITVNHLVVELFREKLESIPLEKAIKVCERIYIMLLHAQYT